MAQLSPLLYSHTPRRPFPDPLIVTFTLIYDTAERYLFPFSSILRYYYFANWWSSSFDITRDWSLRFTVIRDASNSVPVSSLTVPLKTSVSPVRARSSQWQSYRDWAAHGGTSDSHWSDKTFHGVEDECVGSPRLTASVTFLQCIPRDVFGAHGACDVSTGNEERGQNLQGL